MSKVKEPSEINLSDLVACAKREVALRKRVYPGLVSKKRMSPEVARNEIFMMELIQSGLEGMVAAAHQEAAQKHGPAVPMLNYHKQEKTQ